MGVLECLIYKHNLDTAACVSKNTSFLGLPEYQDLNGQDGYSATLAIEGQV
jgi:hypothetical protein